MSQGSSVETLLNSAREILKSLGDSVEHLAQEYPEVFKNPDLASRLESFQATYQEATQRLQTPRLSIATIGTTSSGKSTIVNALIGRKLAPIEAGEMSGGVLTLRHAADSRLVVEPTEGASWQTGEWKDLTDEEIYDRVRDGVMLPYHQKRRGQSKKIIEAPQVTVFGPLLPGVDQSILGLPPGVGIEFIDLPGIKSVQDRTNLAVIQGRVQKSFSLVALDYLQVDDEHRKRLLEELKEVVSFLRGRTESMLFILNRVDQRGGDDLPLEERIASLRKEIKKQLQLQEQPDVLPFSARLLYYAQCSVGLGEALNVSNEKRLEFLQKLFFDCAKEIKGRVSGNKELRRWIRNIEDQVEDEEEVSTADLQKLLDYVYDWSGGRKLWRKLSIRVRESFPELVLLPTLMPILKSYDALSTSIDTIAKIRQIQYGEQVEAKQKEIAHTRKKNQKRDQKNQK